MKLYLLNMCIEDAPGARAADQHAMFKQQTVKISGYLTGEPN